MAVKTTKKTTKKSSGEISTKGKSLVIVESPAKTKTIKKILGDKYIIEASFGHIRDLPPKKLGFSPETDFEPEFVVIPEKKAVVKKLNDIAKKCEKVYLASDPDREGEAIAWHVREVLKVPDEKVFRIEFNEITPKAVTHAIEAYRQIDSDRVKAQQTRQILDKLVGFTISPVLWRKMHNYHLSAGRVQSVALKMIVEREEQIDAFVPVEYWSIDALLNKDGYNFDAELTKYKDKKIEIKNKQEADKILEALKKAKYEVDKVTSRESSRKPTAPFITSTLQRAASNKLGYGVSKTMQIAQKLYEGIEIDGEPIGLITYMRTDSVRVSDDAVAMAKDFITGNYGQEYYPAAPNNYVKTGKKNVQDAHEAIRPSYIDKTPESIKKYLTPEQYKLYKLIWEKFVSSQMASAKVKNTTVEIAADDYTFKIGSSKILFEGFLKLYNDDEEEDVEKLAKIPELKKGEILDLKKLNSTQHFTQPPPRFTEASLVKQLEEYGIGRPSTYAPIISKIQNKGYVEKIEKALAPTVLGKTLCKQLVEHFVDIMDYSFTAGMEEKLDKIAEHKLVWNKVLKDFYYPFISVADKAKENMDNVLIESDEICEKCGKKMIVRTSRFGKQFLGCSGYPECKNMKPLPNSQNQQQPQLPEQPTDPCSKCGGETVYKVGPYGPYSECTKCKARKSIVLKTGVNCPKCGKEIVQRKSRYGKIFYGCSGYPDCDFALWNEPTGEKWPECGSLLVKRVTQRFNQIKCSSKDCKYFRNIEDSQSGGSNDNV
ncbi:type I DNA topoisomerase [bacterium]|nr:type I DNA topoisomerase [bacterium]